MKKIMFLLTILIGCIVMISGCKGESDVLSDDEIKRFNSEFFNGGTDNRNNMMLSSEYDRPENIDLFQLFYNGIGGVEDQVSEEEEALLAELNSEAPYLDIVKVTTDEMNGFLEEKLGIQLDETKKSVWKTFITWNRTTASILSLGTQTLTGVQSHPVSGNLIRN